MISPFHQNMLFKERQREVKCRNHTQAELPSHPLRKLRGFSAGKPERRTTPAPRKPAISVQRQFLPLVDHRWKEIDGHFSIISASEGNISVRRTCRAACGSLHPCSPEDFTLFLPNLMRGLQILLNPSPNMNTGKIIFSSEIISWLARLPGKATPSTR